MQSNVNIRTIWTNMQWSLSERVMAFQLFFILFERFFVQLGASNAIIYILDIFNIYLLLNLFVHNKNKKFNTLILIYSLLIIGSIGIAFANFSIYGNNIIFTVLEVRNLGRFLIFFLAVICYMKIEHLDRIFFALEVYFWINSVFIIYQYFTYFPPTASWMRGDLLNGFFGNIRGGNTFVNVEMLVVVLFLFVKWTKRETKIWHFLLTLAMSLMVAGLIELKAYFIEVAAVYLWYLLCVKKSKREKKLNIIIIVAAIVIAYWAVQIMLLEYPWFVDSFTLHGLFDTLVSENYASVNDLNRFNGMFTISKQMFHGNIIDILFGIGLGNGAVSNIAGHMTKFASMYSESNYSWFQGTYLFVQCGLVGLILYFATFVILLVKKKENKYKTYSNMIILLAFFLIFYGETLKTDAGYFIYFAIATGFMSSEQNVAELEKVKENDIVNNSTGL